MTDDHPFWVDQLGWVESDDLQPGMLVLDLEGDRHGVKGMTPSGVSGLAYNFEVEGFHTYFVGVENVWVHNCDEGVPNSGTSGASGTLTTRNGTNHHGNSTGSSGTGGDSRAPMNSITQEALDKVQNPLAHSWALL